MFKVCLKTTKLGYIKRQPSKRTKPSVKSVYGGRRVDWAKFQNTAATGGKVDKVYQATHEGAIFHIGRVFNNIVKPR